MIDPGTVKYCMSGSIYFREDGNRWILSWHWKGKEYKISRYQGEIMHRSHPNKNKDRGYINAEKLKAQMQGDVENGTFRIEKYTTIGWTDTIPYFETWLKTKEKKKPATYKGYKSYFINWIKPFFEKHPVQLHDIQLDTLDELLDSITLSGKGKHNVMMCFHAFMDFAWRSRRIFEIPPFPNKSEYNIVEPTIKWLPSERQIAIIEAIPEEHQPIFWFLKYHLRRPSEACALHKCDYDFINKIFIIHRGVSARTVMNSTKTGKEHIIPCHSNMIPLIDYLSQLPGDYMFQNPGARMEGKRYHGESLNRLWKEACKKTGETIDLYSGLKHSSCSQYVNEQGMSLSDLQIITDHARIDSVHKYAKTEVARKREMMEAGKGSIKSLLRLIPNKD